MYMYYNKLLFYYMKLCRRRGAAAKVSQTYSRKALWPALRFSRQLLFQDNMQVLISTD